MSNSYEMTGFQSACAEFHEKSLSLDEEYLTNRPANFIVEVRATSRELDVKKGDRLIIDRSLTPKEGKLALLVVNNEFTLKFFSRKMIEGQDPEIGDFVWGMVTTILRNVK